MNSSRICKIDWFGYGSNFLFTLPYNIEKSELGACEWLSDLS